MPTNGWRIFSTMPKAKAEILKAAGLLRFGHLL